MGLPVHVVSILGHSESETRFIITVLQVQMYIFEAYWDTWSVKGAISAHKETSFQKIILQKIRLKVKHD